MVFFFVDRSFTYKAHCVLWQLKWTDLLDLNYDSTTTVLLPSVPTRPRTYDPSRQLRRGYPVGLKTLMHTRLSGRTRLLRFQAGSSGLLARKWPSRCGSGDGCPCRARHAAPCSACPHARQTRLQPGYIEISSLLYCDNCTLIGTGLEMTRPAYRLHIVSHIHWPFLAKTCWFEICCQCGSYNYNV